MTTPNLTLARAVPGAAAAPASSFSTNTPSTASANRSSTPGGPRSIPADKAILYEVQLGDGIERSQYCGCTENRACPGGCSWLDRDHTVCSALACARKHNEALFKGVFGMSPAEVFHAHL